MTPQEKIEKLTAVGVPIMGTGADSFGNYLRFENGKLIFHENDWTHPHNGDFIKGVHREDDKGDYEFVIEKMENYYFNKNREKIMEKVLYKP